MPRITPPAFPRQKRQLVALGQRVRNARLRRRISQALMAERIGISLPTIRKLEAGDPTISVATLIRALHVLQLGADIDLLAADDPLGRQFQDSALKQPYHRRATIQDPS